MKTGSRKNCISLRIAAALLVLTLFALCINSSLFAKYTTTREDGDLARVATFSITVGESYTTPTIEFSDMAPGESRQYVFSVSSASDVAADCLVRLSATANLPLTFTVNDIPVGANGSAVSIFTLAPHQGETNLTLTAFWSAEKNMTSYLGEIDAVRLTVTAEQTQEGGVGNG